MKIKVKNIKYSMQSIKMRRIVVKYKRFIKMLPFNIII